jgi:hypothetical protein
MEEKYEGHCVKEEYEEGLGERSSCHVLSRHTSSVLMLLGWEYLSHCIINPIILKQTMQAGNIHWQETA